MLKSFAFPLISISTIIMLFFVCVAPVPVQQILIKESLPSVSKKAIFCQYSISLPVENVITREQMNIVGGTAIGIGKRTLLTAAHVFTIAGSDFGVDYKQLPFHIDIRDRDATIIKRIPIKIEKVGDPYVNDVAILSTSEDIPCYMELESMEVSNQMQIGDPVYIVGAQHGLSPFNVSLGMLSAKSHPAMKTNFWQISTVAWSGNSGGGVYDYKTNQLIGIVSKIAGSQDNHSDVGNCTLIVPFRLIKDFCK